MDGEIFENAVYVDGVKMSFTKISVNTWTGLKTVQSVEFTDVELRNAVYKADPF